MILHAVITPNIYFLDARTQLNIKIFFNFFCGIYIEGCGLNAAYRKPCVAYKSHTQSLLT